MALANKGQERESESESERGNKCTRARTTQAKCLSSINAITEKCTHTTMYTQRHTLDRTHSLTLSFTHAGSITGKSIRTHALSLQQNSIIAIHSMNC